MPIFRYIFTVIALLLPFHVYSEEFVICRTGDFRFGFAHIPESEIGDIILALWMKGEEKKFTLGETIRITEAGDISAEFPPRSGQHQGMKGSIFSLIYTASLNSATLITKSYGRNTGEAIPGLCTTETIPNS